MAELRITGGRESACLADGLTGRLEIQAPRVLSFFEPDAVEVVADMQVIRVPGGITVAGSGLADGEPVTISGGGVRPDGDGMACPAKQLKLDLAILPVRGEHVREDGAGSSRASGERSTAARMRVNVLPRRPRARRLTTFRIATRTPTDRPVRGATVPFAGRRAVSDVRGVATIRARPRRSGLVLVRATADGHQSAARRVRVLRAR